MKALVKARAERGIWLQDVPEPEVGDNDVLIKIRKTAICGTDLHIYEWNEWAQHTIPVPMHVGHEFVGEIVQLGKNVKGHFVGERVSGEGHVVCGHCRNCKAGNRHLCINTSGVGVNRPGAFAEYLSIPAENVFSIPEGVTDDEAAILDPLGNATHTALAFDVIGEDVLITGAGPIGIMAGAIVKHNGAKNVVMTDKNPYRMELARKMGIEHIYDTAKKPLKEVMKELKMTEGFDVGLEMSGNKYAFNELLSNIKMGANVALLGLLPSDTMIPWSDVIFKSVTIKCIYGRKIFETWYKMCAMLVSGLDVDPIITHHFPIKDYIQGFETMASGNSGKIILEWDK